MMGERPAVLMIGIDAADADIIDSLIRRGRMPRLQRLRESGLYGRLVSPADRYAGGVWPTFYTSTHVPTHGVYHSKLWRADRMRIDVAAEDWTRAQPVWEQLTDLRSCVIDVPMVLGPAPSINGIHLAGWATHDVISRGSSPASLWAECERRHGAPLMPPEQFGRQNAATAATLPATLIAATNQLRDVALDLLQREQWDLMCVVFGAAHRGGHYLWDGTLESLASVYEAVDAAVGVLLDGASTNTLVIAFALHGMGPNAGWSDLLPDVLAELERHGPADPPRRGALYRLRQRIPFHWVRPVLQRLPLSVNQRLVGLWSRNMYDWSRTRWFPLPMDQAGYLRINLRGREQAGIVEPGREYDATCAELTALLRSLRDASTGQQIVRSIDRAWADAAADAPGRDLLPDLIVRWDEQPSSAARRLVSDALPEFSFDVPAQLPSGRTGNHTDRAWFIAHGPSVAAGQAIGTPHVVDLLPTALHHLGVCIPPNVEGRPIDLSRAG